MKPDRSAPRLLLLLGQSPFDPTSGAAQSTRLIAEILAAQGFQVRSLATTACEGDLPSDHAFVLKELNLPTRPEPASFLSIESENVRHTLLPVDATWKHDWEHRVGAAYEQEYARILNEWSPDFVLTYGGDGTDLVRRRRARESGAKVIFALHNLAYRKQPLGEVDAFLAPTNFLADSYRGHFGVTIKVLPPPLDAKRVVAPTSEASTIVFINPEPAKGAILMAQLADRLGRLRSDIPLLIVGGRAPAETLTVIGRDLGLTLSRHSNLYQIPPTGRVSEIWGTARLVLMPSVVKEAAGRCALEAMLNGVIPLVSNQAGLAEVVGEAGIKLPPPPELTGRAKPVPDSIVDAWWNAMIRLFDHTEERTTLSNAARVHAARYTTDAVGGAYNEWLRSLAAGEHETARLPAKE
ncbi:MAG: hypothetical protein JWM32_559 [Verrucomicrobia bacterium]|nr:hypothetical protein [Verrucomicrobiota bacterium]